MAKRKSPEPEPSPSESRIRVRGARVHNLRHLDVDIPRDRLVVLTGVSGSGKSSLAFDTLYAEGQRRYIEGLSSFARQFLDQLERPDVDLIEGLPPTVAIDQSTGSANPRSTVATVTEIHDYLRILYARTGIAHCPACGQEIRRQTPEQMVAGVLAMREGRKVLILAPLVRGRKGQHLETFEAIRRAGLIRARVDGQIVELTDAPPKLAKTKVHDIEAVVDRLVVRAGIQPRLAESIDLALKLADGSVLLSAQRDDGWEDFLLSVNFACPQCGTGFEELEPRTFSANSPYGACPRCDGLGVLSAFDPDLVVPDTSRSLDHGAIAAWHALGPRGIESQAHNPALVEFLKRHRLRRTTPLSAWPASAFQRLLNGDPAHNFPGVLASLEREFESAKTDARKAALRVFRDETPCPECRGSRLRPEARAVTVGGRGIHEVAEMPILHAREFFDSLTFPPGLEKVGPPLVREIANRLGFLNEVGVGYLTLARGADTLSGGELRRVRLATQIGSGLVGVCYILDEPTAGLHPLDADRLLASLRALRDQGNSVLVVEHDEATIRSADWLVDLGPGAGPEGGLVVAQGPPGDLSVTGDSATFRYLTGAARIAAEPRQRVTRATRWIEIQGATERNLKSVDARIPLQALTCVSGVSGSGKSTLVHEVLTRAIRRALKQAAPRPGGVAHIGGLDAIDQVIEVDQSPIGRGPRSTPATYTGVYDEIRRLYARTREAKIRGYGASRFSFNVKGGRCETCEGQGVRKVEMHFLPDLYVPCDVCQGKRFNRQTLEIQFKGRSIGDVLETRVDAALELFDAQPKILRGLTALHEAGLGYVTLGQSSTTLSGGEAQRVKLAAELGRPATERTLYILDEPTTGLHLADVERLLRVLHRLVDQGSTVIVVEHNLDVIKTADWVVDLGPGGGESGGQVIAMGPPADVAASAESYTGRFLRPAIDPRDRTRSPG
jgi:excinuclease ABC subunit A